MGRGGRAHREQGRGQPGERAWPGTDFTKLRFGRKANVHLRTAEKFFIQIITDKKNIFYSEDTILGFEGTRKQNNLRFFNLHTYSPL
jgi:hypothetical protein